MESKSNANSAILATNGLKYKMPMPLSTTLVRTQKRQYSQKQSYDPSDTIVFDLNVSGQVDPENSYFTFRFVSDQSVIFGPNGFLSLIRDIRISSKNGVELERIQHLNQYSNWWVPSQNEDRELEKTKLLTGHEQAYTQGQAVGGLQVCIPMAWLTGMFRPHVKGQKIPSMLLSGARVEIVLESLNRGLDALTATPPTFFRVEKPTIVLMEHVVNDNTLKVLTEESSQNGLEYTYDRVFTSYEESASTSINFQIKKAVSQATSITTTIHDPANQNNISENSFNSIDVNATPAVFGKFQYRLASNYFPHQVIDNIPEAYSVSDMTTKKESKHTYNEYVLRLFNVSTPLKSEHGISSSGLAVNNSASVALEYEGNASNKTYYTFLTYTCLARAFLNQVSVKI
jgi:hypothetical protein